MMVSEGGTIFAVTLVRNKATGRESLFMLDAYGNIYYDSGDRNQGLYIVRLLVLRMRHVHLGTSAFQTVL